MIDTAAVNQTIVRLRSLRELRRDKFAEPRLGS